MSQPDLRASLQAYLQRARRGFFGRLFSSRAEREALCRWNEELLRVIAAQQQTLDAFNGTLVEHERRTVEQSAQILALQQGLAAWEGLRHPLRLLGAQVAALTAHATAAQSEIVRLSGLAAEATTALEAQRDAADRAGAELRARLDRQADALSASLRDVRGVLESRAGELQATGERLAAELARHKTDHAALAESLREVVDISRGHITRIEATIAQMASQLGRVDAHVVLELGQAAHERVQIRDELLQQKAAHDRLGRELKGAADFSRTLAAHADASLVRIKDELGKVAAARASIEALGETISQKLSPRLEETRQKVLDLDSGLQKEAARVARLYRERGPDDPELFSRFYLAFENQFRGTPKEVAAKTEPYLPAIRKIVTPKSPRGWVDLGCGRGEWLEELARLGLEPVGVDNSPAMLKVCRERGLNVIDADALEYMQKLPADSLLGVSGFHIIEHLPYRTLLALVSACWRAIKPGGCLIFETPNPQNVSVGACNFYMDVTHQKPIPPMTAEFMVRHAGFREVKVLRLNPYERHAQRDSLPTVTDREYCEMFYGPRDYGIIAYK